jgi:hypothetical protein
VQLRSICGTAAKQTLSPHHPSSQGETAIPFQAIVSIAEIYPPLHVLAVSQPQKGRIFRDLCHIW